MDDHDQKFKDHANALKTLEAALNLLVDSDIPDNTPMSEIYKKLPKRRD